MENFEIGNTIVKNDENWKSNKFDVWGRGTGIGRIIKSEKIKLNENEVLVKWSNGGICVENTNQIEHSSLFTKYTITHLILFAVFIFSYFLISDKAISGMLLVLSVPSAFVIYENILKNLKIF